MWTIWGGGFEKAAKEHNFISLIGTYFRGFKCKAWGRYIKKE